MFFAPSSSGAIQFLLSRNQLKIQFICRKAFGVLQDISTAGPVPPARMPRMTVSTAIKSFHSSSAGTGLFFIYITRDPIVRTKGTAVINPRVGFKIPRNQCKWIILQFESSHRNMI